MKKRKRFSAILMGVAVVGLSAYVGYRTYDAYVEKQTESNLLLENVEALASQDESEGDKPTVCPNPYDVPDHYLGYIQRTGTQTVDAEGYITVANIRIPVGAKAGATIEFTYEIGDCSNSSKGACCPYPKIGDILNVSILD